MTTKKKRGRVIPNLFYFENKIKGFPLHPHAKGSNQISSYNFHFLKKETYFYPVTILKSFLKV
jgi:hypothetical protein